jgi:hypothetical protein
MPAPGTELGGSECRWQSSFATLADPPCPAGRGSSSSGEGAGQAIGADRMGTPVGLDREPWGRRYEQPIKRACQDGIGKDSRQGLGAQMTFGFVLPSRPAN